MKNLVIASVVCTLALSLASYSHGTSSCTPEAVRQKSSDLMSAMQVAMKDPAKATADAANWKQAKQELIAQQIVAGKNPTDNVCKAYDDLIRTIKS
jgi:hypothetical protein